MIPRVIYEGKVEYELRRRVPCRLVLTMHNTLLAEVLGSPDGLGNPRWSICDEGHEKAILQQFIQKVLAEGWRA